MHYLMPFGSPSTIMPTSVEMSAAVNEDAALIEWRVGNRLFHDVNPFLLINLGRVE
jgi:hypothetical protein